MSLPVSGLLAIVAIGSAALYLAVAWVTRPSIANLGDFFYAARRIGAGDYAATFAGANITLTSIFVFFASQASSSGYAVLWGPIFWIIGIIIFVALLPRLQGFFANGHTLHQYLSDAYNEPRVRPVASIITVFAFVGTVGLEFLGFIWLLEYFSVSAAPALLLGVVLVAIMAVYSSLGGYWATIRTDWWQVLITVAGVCALLYGLEISPDSGFDLKSLLLPMEPVPKLLSDPALLVSFAVLFIPFQFSVMDMWQRCIATGGNLKTIRLPLLVSGVGVGLIFIVPILVGVAARGLSGHSDLVLFDMVGQIASPVLIGLVGAMFLASVFSTADTLLLAASNSILYDFWLPRVRNVTPKEYSQSADWISNAQLWVWILAALALSLIGLSELGVPLQNLIFGVFSAQVILGILVIYSIVRPKKASRRTHGALWSAVVGLVLPIPIVIAGSLAGSRSLVASAPVLSTMIALPVLFLAPTADMNRENRNES